MFKKIFLLTVAFSIFFSCKANQDIKDKIQKPQPPPVTIDEPKLQPPQEKIDPKLEEKIKKLVEQLGAEDSKDREKATEELIKIGEPALEAVKKALANPPSNEVKERAQKIIEEIEWGKGLEALKEYEKNTNKGKTVHLIEILDEKSVDAVIRESFPMFRFFTQHIRRDTCGRGCQGAHWSTVLAIRRYENKVYVLFNGHEVNLFKAEAIRFKDEESIHKLVKVLIRTNHISTEMSGLPVENYKLEKKSSVGWVVHLSQKSTKPHFIIKLNEEGILLDVQYQGIQATKGGNVFEE